MSAIAGALRRDGADPIQVRSALAALTGRFRGAPRIWSGGDAALGGDALEIIPLNPSEPASSARAIAVDARLDNRDELLSILGGDQGWSNARLILTAYRKWGEDTPAYLLGDFAFALWDPARATLFCARDHLGIRPFLYAKTAGQIVFGSELKAILAFGGQHQFNETRICDFLTGFVADTHSTDYADIFRLPPGHCLRVRQGTVEVSAYWRPSASASIPAKASVEAFADLFAKAVSCRMTPTAASMLSGGLDSSAISVTAAKSARSPLKTFSLVFEDCQDERLQIDDVLRSGNFSPTLVSGDRVGPFDDFDRMLREQDGLFQAPTLANNRQLYLAGAQSGASVLLDGHGGDEVVSHGLGWLKELSLAGRWRSLWRNLPAESDVYQTSRLGLFLTYWSHFGAARRIIGKAHRLGARLERRVQRTLGHAASPPAWRRFINPAFAQDAGGEARWSKALVAQNAFVTESDQHIAMLNAPIQAHALEVLDRASSHAGIEARYPFWDKRLVEFCLSLEPEDKIRDGWTRYTFRRAMEGVLPKSIQWRRDKFDFTPALATAMCKHNRALLDEVLLTQHNNLSEFVNLPRVQEAYTRVAAQPQNALGQDVQAVWRATALALWLRARKPQPSAAVAAAARSASAAERAHA